MKKRYWLFLLCIPMGLTIHHFFFSSVLDDGKMVVAVIDSGVDYKHEDLKGRVIKGYDFVDSDDDPMDENGHGTHVAAQILMRTNEAKVLAIRTLNKEGEGGGESILGVIYAIWKGADIINMSYSETYHPYMPYLIWWGEKRDILFVASTGNDGKDDINYPAKYKGVIPIGAIDEAHDQLYEGGNLSKEVAFVAPGVLVEGADLDNEHILRTGTSMATGYASGIMASTLEQHPEMTKKELLSYLKKHTALTEDNAFHILEYGRFMALKDHTIPYVKLTETFALTEKEHYQVPLETMNIDKVKGFDEFDNLIFTATKWEKTLPVPLKREGYQQITLRFYNGEKYEEKIFDAIKDTKPPEISYLYNPSGILSFIVTDTTFDSLFVNGKIANQYIQPTRRKDYTYRFIQYIGKQDTPIVIEIEDKLGHKTTKTYYQ